MKVYVVNELKELDSNDVYCHGIFESKEDAKKTAKKVLKNAYRELSEKCNKTEFHDFGDLTIGFVCSDSEKYQITIEISEVNLI